MHPILFKISIPGSDTLLSVPSYGFVAVTAVLTAFFLFVRSRHILGKDLDSMLLVAVEILALGLFGSSLGNGVLILLGQGSITEPFGWKVFASGLAWQGGLLLAIPLGIWYIRFMRFPVRATLDALTIPVLVGYTIGRIGCFLAGCCYGKPTSLVWGITYPPGNPFGGAPSGVSLHPTPLYAAISSIIVIGILIKTRPLLKKEGHFFLSALALNSFARFLVEFLRGDHGPLVGFLTSQQIFALACIAAVLVLILRERPLSTPLKNF